MLPNYIERSTSLIILAIALNYLMTYAIAIVAGTGFVTNAISFLARILFIWGCSLIAKGKGYSYLWGTLGVVPIIGWLILIILPSKDRAF
jgi:uncharacterized membrane protein